VALQGQHQLTHVNAQAAALGVQPGHKRATALALAPQLLLAEAAPARDAAALQAVVHAALAFTPAVTVQDALTVLLDVQASLRLFGGLHTLRQRLGEALAPLRHRVQVAAAPTALGAALLAQWHPRGQGDLVLGPHATQLPALQALLDTAPVWMLGSGRDHGPALQGMGLHTLAELRALPRAGLARRFGEGLLDELDRALGLQPDPRRFAVLPAVFEGRLELHTRAENTEQVLHGAAVLLARLVAWAQAQHARVGAFTLRMLHERQRQVTAPPTELHVALAEPALDAAHLQSLLRERLAHCQLAEPTLELRLHCQHLVAGHAPNGELFPTRASADEGLTRLLERLRARLGDAQVLRLQPVADHRPERATRAVPVQGPALSARGAAATGVDVGAALQAGATSTLPLHRPAWLLPEPVPLATRDTQPLLQGRPLQLVSGPERIESGWWDGAVVARDYFIALAEDGSLVWLYRSRLPAVPGEVTWFLQGRFA
jgi:protein ImuB